jgi:predicted GIY-YIG superfamily endonuclease
VDGMKYVYMMQSISFPERHYVGSTFDLKRRFADHNAGEIPAHPKIRTVEVAWVHRLVRPREG